VQEVLVVDDESSMREFLGICLKRAGYKVSLAPDLAGAQRALAAQEFDLVVTDLRLGEGGDGLAVLDHVKAKAPETQVVVVTAYATPETAIAAMKRGAYDYLTKPFKVDEIQVVVDRALEKRRLVRENATLRDQISARFRLDRLLGKSVAMQRVFDLVRKVATSRTTVLLSGESGTGKELVARAVHAESPRVAKPFIAVNCGAIPDAILESELFGHVKGAFTGAAGDKMGLFESANGGTLLLDEIGELSAALQVKLLRALQERKVKPVGGVHEREVDVRVVAATNRDLEAEVARGAFRQDLYYRLNVIEIRLPPLSQRREDIPLLSEHFVRKFAAEHGRPVPQLAPEALQALCDYDFPGNVRELENLIERAITLESSAVIGRASLPDLKPQRQRRPQPASGETELPPEGIDLERVVGDYERELLLAALRRTGGVRKEAAHLLGVTFRSLRYRLAKLGVDVGPGDKGDEDEAETRRNDRD
jgi:two-component system response regulator PilR (NtrC family)